MALAGVAMAQQPNEEASPGKKKQQGAEHTQPAHQQPTAKCRSAARDACNGHAATNEPATAKGHKAHQESATAQQTNGSGQPAASATPGGEIHKKGMTEHAAKTSPAPAATAAARASATPAVSTATQQKGQANVAAEKGQANVAAGAKKKPDQQQVQQIKAQHANFRAQPKPQQVPAVTYNQNYRIQGSDRWQGPQYEVFRSYHPEWHDRGLVSLALHAGGADRWRLLLLEQRLLVSGVGLQSFGPILCLRRPDLCRVNMRSRRTR